MSAGLTAGYAFNETSGTTAADASGHAIVGTLTNGPTWTTGKYENAVNLDGVNDYVNLGTPAALQITGSLTLSAWVDASTFPVDDAAVVSKRASGELGFQLDVTKDTGVRTIGFKLTNSSGGQMFRYGATTLQANTWYHIAGVYDVATQSLHVYTSFYRHQFFEVYCPFLGPLRGSPDFARILAKAARRVREFSA